MIAFICANRVHFGLPAACLIWAAPVSAERSFLYGEEQVDARLAIGTLDGRENDEVLRHDGHHFTLGIIASSPAAWNGRIATEMEIWLHERGYGSVTTAAGTVTDSITYQSAALAYGLRVQGGSALRPYGVATLGFQGTRLSADTLTATDYRLTEETLEPLGLVGIGIEWTRRGEIFSIDWRRAYVKGDFTKFDLHDVELGGDYLGIGLGRRW